MFEGTFFFRQHTGESSLGVYSALFRFLIDVFRAIYISSDLLTIRDILPFAYLFCVCFLYFSLFFFSCLPCGFLNIIN